MGVGTAVNVGGSKPRAPLKDKRLGVNENVSSFQRKGLETEKNNLPPEEFTQY